jgi:hypothetical protein
MRAIWSFAIESLKCLSSPRERPDTISDSATLAAHKIVIRRIYKSRPALNPDALADLYDACREFVRRCDCGEVRSRRSYAQMKAAVEKAETT